MVEDYIKLTAPFETITDFLRFGWSKALAQDLFYGHGTDNAWDDVYSLVMRSLNLPYDCPKTLWKSRLTIEEKKLIAKQLYLRIESRIPVPYLIKEAYFSELPFYVDERVLIPRSPIAELIEAQFSPWVESENVHRILDLCTGSGCIAIACCYAFPEASVDAVDISADALEVAKINRAQLEVESQLNLIQSDCFEAVPKVQYDIIVTNPPYVSATEMQTLPQEYLHEPNLALEAPHEGLLIVELILNQAAQYLTDTGILVVEVGNTAETMVEMYPDVPFTWLEFERGGEGIFLLTKQDLLTYFSSPV